MIKFVVIAILIFGILIALHEFGHFLAAKAFGVPVFEFSVGMGPLIWQRQIKETDYSLVVTAPWRVKKRILKTRAP